MFSGFGENGKLTLFFFQLIIKYKKYIKYNACQTIHDLCAINSIIA